MKLTTDHPLVSIIVPIYNVEKYLDQCIVSLINQTYQNIEILLLNDGSTDNSPKICNKYKNKDNRIIYISQANKGLSATRNNGIKIAKGEFILFVDSDDYVSKDIVAHLLSLAIKFNSPFVAANYKKFKDGHNPKESNRKRIKIKEYSGAMFSELMAKPMGVNCFACLRLIHKSLINNLYFPEDKIFEDIFTMPKLIYDCNNVISTSEILYYYRIRNTSLSHKRFSMKALHEMDAYLDLMDFGIMKHDKKIIKYTSMFFLTKYYYYTLKIIYYKLGLKSYRDKYKENAKKSWRMLIKNM